MCPILLPGLRSLKDGGPPLRGNIQIAASPNLTASQLGQTITISGEAVTIPVTTAASYYYEPAGAPTTFGPANGVAQLTPIWLPGGVTVDRLGVWLQTNGSAGAVARLGLYLDSGGCFPGNLLVDAGTAAVTAGAPGNVELAGAQGISAGGLYWLCLVTQGNPTPALPVYAAVNGYVSNLPFFWCGTSSPANTSPGGYVASGVTGALPNLGAAALTVPSANQLIGRAYLRIQ